MVVLGPLLGDGDERLAHLSGRILPHDDADARGSEHAAEGGRHLLGMKQAKEIETGIRREAPGTEVDRKGQLGHDAAGPDGFLELVPLSVHPERDRDVERRLLLDELTSDDVPALPDLQPDVPQRQGRRPRSTDPLIEPGGEVPPRTRSRTPRERRPSRRAGTSAARRAGEARRRTRRRRAPAAACETPSVSCRNRRPGSPRCPAHGTSRGESPAPRSPRSPGSRAARSDGNPGPPSGSPPPSRGSPRSRSSAPRTSCPAPSRRTPRCPTSCGGSRADSSCRR